MGSAPTTQRSASEVTAICISLQKEDRESLSNSEKTEALQVNMQKGVGYIHHLASDGKLVNDFQTVYDFHIRLEDLSEALTHFGMTDIFQIIPSSIDKDSSSTLTTFFACQATGGQSQTNLASDPRN